uniref:DDT domain-containing protein n=1 Tax=Anopheles maculatus TaxID=74869 RepID=A0A182SX07_9DIPT
MAGAQITCENDPNFGIILSFMEQFGPFLDIGELNITELKSMLESGEAVPQALVDLHIKLMRKINKKVPAARWELALAKFAHSYSHQDAWEIERFGYKTANLAVKLRVLKALLEGQFDLNTKFKTQINTTGAGELRLDPLGRDRQGNCYWYFMDESANLQIYQSDPEMETWTLVASNRDEFVNMIEMLKDNRPIEPLVPVNAGDGEEEDSAGSMSETEAMKLDTSIPAPSEVLPSLIISRRTYKTPDQLDATLAVEDVKQEHSNSEPADKNEEENIQKPPQEDSGEERKEDSEMKTEPIAAKEPPDVMVEKDEPMNEADQEALGDSVPVDASEAVKMEVEQAVPATEAEMQTDDLEKGVPMAKEEQNESETMQDGNEKEVSIAGSKQSETTDVPVGAENPEGKQTNTKESREESDKHVNKTGTTALVEEEGVSEAIQDPPLVVKGEGSGADCNSGIELMFSEVIEEPVMFVYGFGAGHENDMGNTKKVEAVSNNAKEGECDNDCDTAKAGNGETELPQNREGNGDNKNEELDLSRKAVVVVPTKEQDAVDDVEKKNHGQKCELLPPGSSSGDADASTEADAVLADKKQSSRGKRNESMVLAQPQDKPVEKRRGSRKSNTPKKAFDATVTAVSLQIIGAADDEKLDKDGEAFRVETAVNKPSENANAANNGDHTASPSKETALKEEMKGTAKEVDSKERQEVVSTNSKTGSKSTTTNDVVKSEPGKEEEEEQKQEPPPQKDEKPRPEHSIVAKEEQSETVDDNAPSDQSNVKKESDQPEDPEGESPPKRKRRHRNGLVDGLDISMVLDAGSDGGGSVRQSRRIAMQKIKEETNRREIEDQMLKKMKADAVKKKKDLGMKISDDDYRAERSEHSTTEDSSS